MTCTHPCVLDLWSIRELHAFRWGCKSSPSQWPLVCSIQQHNWNTEQSKNKCCVRQDGGTNITGVGRRREGKGERDRQTDSTHRADASTFLDSVCSLKFWTTKIRSKQTKQNTFASMCFSRPGFLSVWLQRSFGDFCCCCCCCLGRGKIRVYFVNYNAIQKQKLCADLQYLDLKNVVLTNSVTVLWIVTVRQEEEAQIEE